MNIDPRIRRPQLPSRVLWQEGVRNADILLFNDIGQARAAQFPCCSLQPGGSLLLDFGRELHGGLQLVCGPTPNNRAARLRVRFGESASEAMGTPNNDHALHDMEIVLPPMSAQEYGLTAFRFVRLDSLETDLLEIPIVAARAMTLMRPLQHVGAFECNDERLNQIWRVGADTVALCMQDYLWDGPKRDRLVWMGDLHPEIAVVSAVWGEHEIVPQSLDWVRDHTHQTEWMNGIGSYSMWWILIQRDWFRAHGNREYLDEQREYMLDMLPHILEQIGEDGNVNWRGSQFLDWPSSTQPEAVRAGLVALLVMTLEAAAQICEIWGETGIAAQCSHAVAALRGTTLTIPRENKQASSLVALADLVPPKAINDEVLAVDPLHGLSTFYGYYVLQARALAGDYDGALDVIRKYWGAMLDLGATSFWEHFELEWADDAARIDEIPNPQHRDIHRDCGDYCYKGWRHSLCHGWAAGPTAWLSQHVLGVEVSQGGSVVKITPHLGDLEWARGAFPTPHGPLKVSHQHVNGELETEFEAPQGVEVIQ